MLQAAKLARMRIAPSELFLSETHKYSRFDADVSGSFLSGTALGLYRGGRPLGLGCSVGEPLLRVSPLHGGGCAKSWPGRTEARCPSQLAGCALGRQARGPQGSSSRPAQPLGH